MEELEGNEHGIGLDRPHLGPYLSINGYQWCTARSKTTYFKNILHCKNEYESLHKQRYKTDLELLGLSMRFLEQTGELNIQECGNVTKIKQADVTEVNRLLEKHRGWNHPKRDKVPCVPHVLPILHAWNTKLSTNYFPGRCGQRRQ
jgi:hypothetical protein